MNKRNKIFILVLIFTLLIQGTVFAIPIPDMNNTAPTANFTMEKKRSVKILVLSDYTGTQSTNLKNSIATMKSGLVNDATINVEYVAPTEISIGSQNGKYIRNKWGMLGYVDYTWTGTESSPTVRNDYVNKHEHSSFVYSTLISLPEYETPTVNYAIPTWQNFETKIDPNTYSSRKYRLYNFYNSSVILDGTLDLWINYNMYDGSGNSWAGDRIFNTEPTFTYNNFWSVIESTDVPITNNVLGWDLSRLNYDVAEGTDTYVVFAMKNEGTNYYAPLASSTYRLGQLRSDANLGKYVKDSNARVYSICSESFENVNLSTNAAYPVTFTPTAQNISLKGLMSLSYDGRSVGNDNVGGLVKSIEENIKKPTGNIDMIIATDKSAAESTGLINSIRSSVSEDASIQTSVINNTELLYNWDKPTFRSDLKVMGIATNYYGYTSTFIVLTPTGELWGMGGNYIFRSGGGGLLGVDVTSPSYSSFIKISDNVKDASLTQTRDGLYNTLLIIKNDGTVWKSPGWMGSNVQPLNKIENLKNIKKIQRGEVKVNSTNETYSIIIALDNDGYLWSLDPLRMSYNATKMDIEGNGSFVDFDLPPYNEDNYNYNFKITLAKNNEILLCNMYTYVNYFEYRGVYNGAPLSTSLWQNIEHVSLGSSPVPISPSLRITDLIKMKGGLDRYFGIDVNKQIYLFGGYTDYSYDNTTIALNSNLTSLTQSTTIPVKAFSKNTILNTPLREASDRYFIYISDSIGIDTSIGGYFPFSNLDDEIANYLKANNFNIYVVSPSQAYDLKLQYPLVPTTMQTKSLRELITASNVDSAFCNNITAVKDIVSNKYSTFTKQGGTSLTLIVNEDALIYKQVYNDYEKDPWYAARWKFDHTSTYFDNSNGLDPNSGSWILNPLSLFSKVGRYTATAQFRDNPKNIASFDPYRLWSNNSPPATILVHRRPIALFSTQINKAGTTLNLIYQDQSYDLDHSESRADKGILAWHWQYKSTFSDTWLDGKPSALTYNTGIYEIKLRVRDVEGAWSNPYTELIDTLQLPPVVDCTPTSRNWANTDLSATVTASDPSGDFSYTLYKWSTSPTAPSSGWLQNNSATFTTTQTNEGIWYLHMEAHDAAGNKFYRYRGPYKIDKTPPVINTVTTDGSPTDANSYNVYANNVTDALSGVNLVRFPTWTSTNGQDDLLSPWTSYYAGTYLGSNNWRYTVNSSVEDGEYNTHVYAFDNAGNYSVKAPPNVTVNKMKIEDLQLTGSWNHWNRSPAWTDNSGHYCPYNPLRFLSLEKVHLNIKTTNAPDRIVIDMSPALKAMQFTDVYGNVYDYKNDFFGYYVSLPITINNPGTDYTWDYILPLAKSTLSWDNVRKNPAYSITVTAYKGSATDSKTISGIEITGNVRDLTYGEPVK